MILPSEKTLSPEELVEQLELVYNADYDPENIWSDELNDEVEEIMRRYDDGIKQVLKLDRAQSFDELLVSTTDGARDSLLNLGSEKVRLF